MKNLGFSESLIEDYADFYFRNFTVVDNNKKKLDEMRKNEKVHKLIQRFMECCAEVQKCNMDNKFYNDQKDKYGKNKNNQSSIAGGQSDGALLQENVWLNQKLDELQ